MTNHKSAARKILPRDISYPLFTVVLKVSSSRLGQRCMALPENNRQGVLEYWSMGVKIKN
jgi:hypothetical protein